MFNAGFAIVFNLPSHNKILDNQIGGTDVVGHNELVAIEGKVGADEADKEATAANIFLPFSLTKYSAIIADVKEYFGIHRHDNQTRLRT